MFNTYFLLADLIYFFNIIAEYKKWIYGKLLGKQGYTGISVSIISQFPFFVFFF